MGGGNFVSKYLLFVADIYVHERNGGHQLFIFRSSPPSSRPPEKCNKGQRVPDKRYNCLESRNEINQKSTEDETTLSLYAPRDIYLQLAQLPSILDHTYIY